MMNYVELFKMPQKIAKAKLEFDTEKASLA